MLRNSVSQWKWEMFKSIGFSVGSKFSLRIQHVYIMRKVLIYFRPSFAGWNDSQYGYIKVLFVRGYTSRKASVSRSNLLFVLWVVYIFTYVSVIFTHLKSFLLNITIHSTFIHSIQEYGLIRFERFTLTSNFIFSSIKKVSSAKYLRKRKLKTLLLTSR